MMSRKIKMGLLGLLAILALTVATTGTVLAQDEAPAPLPEPDGGFVQYRSHDNQLNSSQERKLINWHHKSHLRYGKHWLPPFSDRCCQGLYD